MPADLPVVAADGPLATVLAVLEYLPITAYLLRAEQGDFVLEGVNAAARAKTPALGSMIGRPISLLYADQPQLIEDAHRAHRERTRVVREISVRRHERVEGVRQTLVFASVDLDRIVIYAQDTSDAQHDGAELRELQERYRSLLASLPDAVLLRGADGRVLGCNDAAAQLFGHREASQLWGHVDLLAPGYRVLDPAGQEVVPRDSASQRAAREGAAVRAELYQFITPDGSSRWVRVSAQPVKKGDGSLGGSVTLYSDETERVGAQLAEREGALRLQLALDAGRMGTWEYDPITDVGHWAASMDQIFVLSGPRLGFQGHVERVHPDDRAAMLQMMQDVLAQPDGSTFENEHRIIGDDGVARWARIRGRIERGSGKLRLLGTAMDVTERRRLQDEVLRASRLESLGRLAGGVAHDFNNLLAAMLATVELMSDVCPASAQEDLATLRHITLRARDLTAQLLAFARQQRVELETLDLTELVQKVERLLQRLVGPTSELAISGQRGLCVRADAAQLEQVLVNLVVNARDAMPEGGRIDVRISASNSEAAAGDWVVLEVEDRGRGIDSHNLSYVFDPFFTTKQSGTGLGLASSYGVVKTHGGNITVKSEPGRGASFRVTLPRVAREVTRPPGHGIGQAGRGRVLVVDDDDDVRASTARILQTLGYDVLTAADGASAEALAGAENAQLELLVCDLAMPHKSGPEVAASIRQIFPDIKVLYVSGYPRGSERELPASSFLQKPYDRDALARKLAALSTGNAVTRDA